MTVTALLATIPSPDRGVWQLGPVPIRAYALCIIGGIIVAIWWGERRFVARGGAPGTIVDIAVFAVPFGLVGGRIYHVLTDWPKYFGDGGDPLDALKIWQGGLGIWGAISLGALGGWIGARRKGVPLTAVADAAAPGIVLAQAIGRVGNWFNQELYGSATSLPWGLEIYRRINPDTGAADSLGGVAINNTPEFIVHPTFLYELLWNLGVAALVVWADRRFRLGHGRAFALYVAGYTAGRFWIELLRTDPATEVFGVRINVITSVLVFVGAVVYLLVAPRGRETLPPEVAGEPDETGTAEAVPAAVPATGQAEAAEAGSAEPVGSDVAAAPAAPPDRAGQDGPDEPADVGRAGEPVDARRDEEGEPVRATREVPDEPVDEPVDARREDAGPASGAESGAGFDEGRPDGRPPQGP